eukprot:5553467-Pleurochrysis_carterae.AAC.1
MRMGAADRHVFRCARVRSDAATEPPAPRKYSVSTMSPGCESVHASTAAGRADAACKRSGSHGHAWPCGLQGLRTSRDMGMKPSFKKVWLCNHQVFRAISCGSGSVTMRGDGSST